MLQRTPHSYFYKTQVIRQTGSAHVPRYDSFHSQGFRPLFPSKYRLHSPSHPLWHTRTHKPTCTTTTTPRQFPLPLTRREPLSLQRVWSQYSFSGCKTPGRTAAEPDLPIYPVDWQHNPQPPHLSFCGFIYSPPLHSSWGEKLCFWWPFVPEEETNYKCEFCLCTLYFENAFFITENGPDEKTKEHQSGSPSDRKVKSWAWTLILSHSSRLDSH